MKIVATYLQNEDAFEVAYEEPDQKPYTFKVTRGPGITHLRTVLLACDDMSPESPFEFHILEKGMEEDPHAWQKGGSDNVSK